MDHFHLPSLRRIPSDAEVVCPHGAAQLARDVGFEQINELGPGDRCGEPPLLVEATRAVHKSGRGPHSRVDAPPVGFIIEAGGQRIYFAGDTAFDRKVFTDIGISFGLDIVLLPIGGLRMLGSRRAIDPVQAVEALRLLRPKVVIGIHWGGLPRWLPFIKLPGMPKELGDEVAKAQLSLKVRGMAPLKTVHV